MAYEELPAAGGKWEELPAAVSAGKAINANINSVPRQLGLTARYGLEGLANTAQIVTEPLRYLTDRATGLTGTTTPLGTQATKLADLIGLPSPETANERVIGDATRLVAGGGGMAGGARAAAKGADFVADSAKWLPNLRAAFSKAPQTLAANPTAQLSSAAGAGLAGGASREAGGDQWTQAAASLIGGVSSGLVPGLAGGVANMTRRTVTPALTPAEIDVKLTTVLGRAGTDYSQLPGNVKASLRKELADALKAGEQLDATAVSRLADFKTVGATPTRGMISQNPVQITREQNLAKMAANSADGELHGLPLLQNQNNQTIIRKLNEYGAGSQTEPITAGRLIQDRIQDTNAALGSVEQGAWNLAKNSPGYKSAIYPDGLNAAIKNAGDEGLVGFLPKQITDYMAVFQNGQQPFTPQHYKNLRSMLSGELAKGGNESAAARAAIKGLDSVPMRPITNPGGIYFGSAPVTPGLAAAMRTRDAQAPEAIEAIDRARAATAAKYRYQESSPLVRAALADARTADPEKLAQSFILNGTVNDARAVAREVGPEGMATIRDALATHIKKQALGGASDEVGKVSQSALNAVLKKIGDEKLRMFFSPDELAGLRATGRVASLMQVQPIGSAVNNSNSGALLLGRGMDMLKGVTNKLPFGQAAIVEPLRNINIGISQRQAQNVIPGLLAPQTKAPLLPSLLLPGAAVGGGLLSLP